MSDMVSKYRELYMDMAIRASQESHCGKGQVGACVVTPNSATFIGLNGTITGYPTNVCELEDGTTAPYTIHAEESCLYKMLREGVSPIGGTMFVTVGPCTTCARMIISSGIEAVYYLKDYKCSEGLAMMEVCGVKVFLWKSDELGLHKRYGK